MDYLLDGGIEPGGRMRSERQLAEAFGVGRSTFALATAPTFGTTAEMTLPPLPSTSALRKTETCRTWSTSRSWWRSNGATRASPDAAAVVLAGTERRDP